MTDEKPRYVYAVDNGGAYSDHIICIFESTMSPDVVEAIAAATRVPVFYCSGWTVVLASQVSSLPVTPGPVSSWLQCLGSDVLERFTAHEEVRETLAARAVQRRRDTRRL